jgi:hypothetical protein
MPMPNETYMNEYIKEGLSSLYGMRYFYDSLLTTDNDNIDHIIRIPINDFFIKYRTQLNNNIQSYRISSNYFYKPKTISLELYDTTEFWLSLLRVNNMKSITEFTSPIILIYNPGAIKKLINIFFKREGKIN